MTKYLIVCTGNACRSPMMESYMKDQIAKTNLPFEVKSAGICEDGKPASENAVLAMKELGIDLSAHTTHRLTPMLCNWADKILVMDNRHRDILQMLQVDYTKITVLHVPNPYGKDLQTYRQVRDLLIEKAKPYLRTFQIEDMTEETVSKVQALASDLFSVPWSEQSLREEIDNPHCIFRLALDFDKKLIGYYGIYTMYENADIARIGVDASYRRRGIGSVLLKDAEQKAKEAGCEKMQLEVRASNEAARAFYEKHGFKQDGLRPNYYDKPTEDAVLYSKLLTEENQS